MWYNINKGWIDSMKVISDIRLYKSSSKNEFGLIKNNNCNNFKKNCNEIKRA
mgnify:CR=1 FL=1